MHILEHKPNEIIKIVADLTNSPEKTAADIKKMVTYYSKGKQTPTKLQHHWYESLRAGNPDYSVYQDPIFVVEATACFIVYSRKYLKLLEKIKQELPATTVIYDLGCGVGLTTAAIAEIFPSAKVFGTQIDGPQKEIAEVFSKKFSFSIEPACTHVSNGYVIAFDYAEHFINPIEHFEPIIKQKPVALILANSFSSFSVGHFLTYKINGEEIPNTKMGKKFNSWLRCNGYVQKEAHFYNNRPSIWIKEKQQQFLL